MSSSSVRDGIELRDNFQLIVSEIFGPTIQGEGASIGMPTMFLRLGICNLACDWCDTKYTWDWANYDYTKELKRMSRQEVFNELLDKSKETPHVRRLVISGGAPMLQQSKWESIVDKLVTDLGWKVEVETAGTIAPTERVASLVSQFNVSPKLEHSGNPVEKRYRPEVLRAFKNTDKATFKFVVRDVSDFEEIYAIVEGFSIELDKVFIMPEGQDPETISTRVNELVDRVVWEGYNLTTRLHVLLWGSKRGV